MKKLILADLFAGQDMGQKNVTKIVESVLNGTFDRGASPVDTIIVDAFMQNIYENPLNEDAVEQAITDLDYAINQLSKARGTIFKSLGS